MQGLGLILWGMLGALLVASAAGNALVPGEVEAQVAGLESPPLFLHVAGPPLDLRPTAPPFTPRAPPGIPVPLPPPKQRIFPPMTDIPGQLPAGNADPKAIPKDAFAPNDGSGDLTYGGKPAAGNADGDPSSVPQSSAGYSIEMGVQETQGEDTAMAVVVAMVGLAAAVLLFVGYKARQRQSAAHKGESAPLVVTSGGPPFYGSAVVAGSAV